METFEDNENQNILEDLKQSSSVPSHSFRNSLKARFVDSYKLPFEPTFFFFNEKSINVLSISIVVLSIAIVSIAGVATFNSSQSQSNISDVAAVPSNETSSIIGSIVKNNPDILIAQSLNNDNIQSFQDTGALAKDLKMIAPEAAPKNYNYSYTRSNFELGEMSSACKLLVDTSVKSQEIFTFTSSNGGYLYRVINKDSSGNTIESIQLNNTDNDVASLYTKNGNYGIIINSETLASTIPTSFPVSYLPAFEQGKYFDPVSSTLAVVRRGNEDFYVISSSAQSNCGDERINLIDKKWFSSSDFSLSMIEVFANNDKSENNLIKRTQFSIIKQDINFETVKENFQTISNDLNIIDISDLNPIETLNSILTDKIDLVPVDGEIINIRIANFEEVASQDRKFYKTDADYLNGINLKTVPLMEYAIDDGFETSAQVFNADVADSNILLGDLDSKAITNFEINGINVKANIYTSRVPVSFSEESSNKYLLFTYNQYKYLFKSSDIDKMINKDFNLVGIEK
ncbi:MAG: hypothetical protein ABI721_04695 [Candidatus Dojkabacteria bacterium]